MIHHVEVPTGLSLDEYASHAHLTSSVQELRDLARTVAPTLRGRKVWMVNSTARGGGVAEMLPRMVSMLRELEVDVRWVTIQPRDEAFFTLTKKLHNFIHGAGDGELTADDRALYEKESEGFAEELAPQLSDDDVLVVHDPQPGGMGAKLEERCPGLVSIWRCHIGLDDDNDATRAAWDFLQPYVRAYDHAVFSAAEYIPPYLAGQSTVIAPAIDPLSDKNRPLTVHKLSGILANAGLVHAGEPVLTPDYAHRAERLRPDGSFAPLAEDEPLGLLFRPIVTQISRWDRLKGWTPLLDGFALLKKRRGDIDGLDDGQRRRLELVRLVLAGPDPASVQDDPEGQEVLAELNGRYAELPAEVQADVALLSLPMQSRQQNALMVNALQRCSTVVVQNSLREGFGLTATEAMWKPVPVLGSDACGLRQQIRDGLDGRINPAPEEPQSVAGHLFDMLNAPERRDVLARHGQRRVLDEFLVFAQLQKWLRLLARSRGGTVTPAGAYPTFPPPADDA